jgi:hypothetical protein
MLNWIRFVVPVGGVFAFDALTACRNVQPTPHVDPSVSAVDVTVKVIKGLAVGVGVGVASGESVILWYAAIAGVTAHRFWPKPTSAKESPAEQMANPTRARVEKNAERELDFFFIKGGFS